MVQAAASSADHVMGRRMSWIRGGGESVSVHDFTDDAAFCSGGSKRLVEKYQGLDVRLTGFRGLVREILV